jgi:hypothetical protein
MPKVVSMASTSRPAESSPTAVTSSVDSPSRASVSATLRATPPWPKATTEAGFDVPGTGGCTSR